MGAPRIILWDLETLPNLPQVLKVFPSLSNYPGLTIKASINTIICCGWKVYGEKKTHCINAWDFYRWTRDVNDDYSIVKAAYTILRGADVLVTHNGKRFDNKFLETRLAFHGLPPLPKEIIHIDTCQELKRSLLLFNNRLNTGAEFLTDSLKKEHEGWALWEKVSNRNPKAMRDMTSYCKQDVRVLEKVFKSLIPRIRSPKKTVEAING